MTGRGRSAGVDGALPPELADALRPVLPEVAEACIAAIGEEVPQYARPMQGELGRSIRMGVEIALARFVDWIADPTAGDPAGHAVYAGLGRGEMRSGRTLDALLTAYRLGARISWERFVAAGTAADFPPEVLYRLAGAIFSYIDAISAESVAGFAEEQQQAADERARRRRALARALADPTVQGVDLEQLAVLARWTVPATVAAVVVGQDVPGLTGRLGVDVVAFADDVGFVAWVPDAAGPGRRAELETTLGELPAALGPALVPALAHASLVRARRVQRLRAAGRLPAGGLIVADEHRLELLLGADADLAADLSAHELAPIDSLATPAARERALQTLRAWLDHPGQPTRVGAVLGVHPQTVRYRLANLRELFGDALDDPEARFALGVAVRLRGS